MPRALTLGHSTCRNRTVLVKSPNSRVRRQGITEKLYSNLTKATRKIGVPRFEIFVGESLAPAHRFYRAKEADPHAEISVHGGAKSVIYVQQA